jgi:hypothetical protein
MLKDPEPLARRSQPIPIYRESSAELIKFRMTKKGLLRQPRFYYQLWLGYSFLKLTQYSFMVRFISGLSTNNPTRFGMAISAIVM